MANKNFEDLCAKLCVKASDCESDDLAAGISVALKKLVGAAVSLRGWQLIYTDFSVEEVAFQNGSCEIEWTALTDQPRLLVQ